MKSWKMNIKSNGYLLYLSRSGSNERLKYFLRDLKENS